MSEKHKVKGSCCCKAVQFEVDTMSTDCGACHCTTCRNWGGGPFMAVDCGTQVTFQGQDAIGIYDSSEWAERGFCKQCGSHLFYRLKPTQQHLMPVGLFDAMSDVTLVGQVFIDEKPGFYNFAEKTENMTGAECFAKYGPPQ